MPASGTSRVAARCDLGPDELGPRALPSSSRAGPCWGASLRASTLRPALCAAATMLVAAVAAGAGRAWRRGTTFVRCGRSCPQLTPWARGPARRLRFPHLNERTKSSLEVPIVIT